eukprot:6180547-Pleurochrysis_carterae.AAC.2
MVHVVTLQHCAATLAIACTMSESARTGCEWSSRGAGGRAARLSAPRLWGMRRIHPPHRIKDLECVHPLAAKQRRSKRSRTQRWSGGRSPEAPSPLRPNPISRARGARQPTWTWADP